MNQQSKVVLITGASGLLGRQLVKHLSALNYCVIAVGRFSCPQDIIDHCQWCQIDIENSDILDLKLEFDIVIHAAPVWLLCGFLEKNVKQKSLPRCIVFSSTSAQSKMSSVDAQDSQLAHKLVSAENELIEFFKLSNCLTIFRPTLIYGYGKDKNISVITDFINRFKFFPVAGKAVGLRQPVHVDDLVIAAAIVIDKFTTYGKTYALCGGECLTYRQMIEKIFKGLDLPVRILSLPVPFYRLLLKLKKSDYSASTANRMNQDLNYCNKAAMNDFNYQPALFLAHPKRDLNNR